MPAPTITGVHLLPSTGEFSYDTVAYSGQRAGVGSPVAINTYGGAAPVTDYTLAIEQLQAAYPACKTVSLVVAWFTDGTTAGACNIFPSTTYPGGKFFTQAGAADNWRCSGLTQNSAGLIAIPTVAGASLYGGTPSDQSVVRCIRDLKARGFNVVFYPFLLSIATGEPWRGTITYAPDVTTAATAAVNAFLGAAAASSFTRDTVNLTVGYSGSPTDWSYRRMILHYANLCVVAGGVSLFVLGSEMRGLETVRGPAWTKAGTTDAKGHAVWDYPFVAGMAQLAADVRSVFDAAGLTKSLGLSQNLLTYAADWSNWMGWQHPGANGQWPHLDALWASPNIDFVALDNYLPLSDWTTSRGSQDIVLWNQAKPASWPPANPNAVGLGLSGSPNLYSEAYLQANIEGGEKFNWYYGNSANGGAGPDPLGTGAIVSVPAGDRATQTRQPYYAGQQILANKQYRWWWNNPHHAIYDTGGGWAPQGPQTPWVPNAKPIVFLEYGFANVDKATNEPNVFYAPAASASGTPFWSTWQASGAGYAPQRDDLIAGLALQAVYDYWQANNANVAGVPFIQWQFCCAWNWDARPYPAFPARTDVWSDGSQWPVGFWLTGQRAYAQPAPVAPPILATATTGPTPSGTGARGPINPVTLANRALARFGSAPIQSFDQTIAPGPAVNLLFWSVVEGLFSEYPWFFAEKTVALTPLSEAPLPDSYLQEGWLYSYALPGNAIGPPQRYLTSPTREGDPISRFELQNQTLYCDEKNAWAVCQFIVDIDAWPAYFALAAEWCLAAELVMPISGNSGLLEKLQERAWGTPEEKRMGGFLGTAKQADARARGARTLPPDPLTLAHFWR